MSELIKPHGGVLVDAVLHGAPAAALEARARRLPAIVLDAHGVADLELIASGGASPLRGFMGHADYRSVLHLQRLATGAAFPLPLTLPVPLGSLGAFRYGDEVALRDPAGALLGAVIIRDTFVRDLREEARFVHDTDDASHPAVAELLSRPAGAVGGEVVLLPHGRVVESAREVRLRLAQHGFSRVAAGHGISATAAAHAAAGHADALLVPSLAGVSSIPPSFSIVVAMLPLGSAARQRPSAPREVFLRALMLRNFGVSHLVLGPVRLDLAGAHALVRAREELGLVFIDGAGASLRAQSGDAAA